MKSILNTIIVMLAPYKVPSGSRLTISYGYLGFEKKAVLAIRNNISV